MVLLAVREQRRPNHEQRARRQNRARSLQPTSRCVPWGACGACCMLYIYMLHPRPCGPAPSAPPPVARVGKSPVPMFGLAHSKAPPHSTSARPSVHMTTRASECRASGGMGRGRGRGRASEGRYRVGPYARQVDAGHIVHVGRREVPLLCSTPSAAQRRPETHSAAQPRTAQTVRSTLG